MSVEEEVRKLGCADVFLAYNRREAIKAVSSFRPNFAVLDVSLTYNGEDYDIADLLADNGIPFTFASGHPAGQLPDRHVGRPFIGKPMQSQDLAEAVALALALAQLGQHSPAGRVPGPSFANGEER